MEDNIEKYIREYILKMIYTAKSEIAYFVSSEIENLNKDSQISASETINGAIDYFNKLENFIKLCEDTNLYIDVLNKELNSIISINNKNHVYRDFISKFNYKDMKSHIVNMEKENVVKIYKNVSKFISDGIHFYKINNFKEASSCFNEALKIDPSNKEAKNWKYKIMRIAGV